MGSAVWDATPWHDQRAYMEGLHDDEEVPFRLLEPGEGQGLDTLPDGMRPTVRESVDAGTDVIDLTAMRRELEAGRLTRKQ